MTQQFENFVNAALDKSLSADVTLPTADDIPVFTGIGRQVTGKTIVELGIATTSYIDTSVTKVWKDQGNYDVSGGTAWPTSANTIGAVAIKAGNLWVVAGAAVNGTTLTGGVVVSNGDTLRALIDDAGNNAAHWGANEANLGYTPENLNNKATNLTLPDDTKYPTTKAIVDNVLSILLTNYTVATVNSTVSTTDSSLTAFGKLQKQITDAVANAVSLSALRYVVTTPTIVANAYTVVSTDVNAYGNKILKLTNPTTIAVTLPTPSYLTASIGDSFNIRQGGAGGITITGSITGINIMSIQHTTITLIAESPTSWMSVGG